MASSKEDSMHPVRLEARELPADLETPISAYLKLAGSGPSFLLESVSGGENLARYSFIGVDPELMIRVEGGDDPFERLREEAKKSPITPSPGLPRFTGGLVGYIGYEAVRFCEPKLKLRPDPEIPEAVFLKADTIVAFDHAFGKMLLMARPRKPGAEGSAEARARLDDLEQRLTRGLPYAAFAAYKSKGAARSGGLESIVSREKYTKAVREAKEHIAAGDIFQVVLSQRFIRETEAEPFAIYRALRRINPSPYMYFFDFGETSSGEPFRIIGASPELHVRLEKGVATERPIAGTRPRGSTETVDKKLEEELLADPKEKAEHIMLVDLARNDLGRVCEYGSVLVPERMTVERYSHVMHIVSQVEGKLSEGRDAVDLLKATFPAGTVSGAPKIRAMEIIDELEGLPRGAYAGVVGYAASDGSMDTCITIRTIVMKGKTARIQAGAGIVADSDPDREYEECLNKAGALASAIDLAEGNAPEGKIDGRGQAMTAGGKL